MWVAKRGTRFRRGQRAPGRARRTQGPDAAVRHRGRRGVRRSADDRPRDTWRAVLGVDRLPGGQPGDGRRSGEGGAGAVLRPLFGSVRLHRVEATVRPETRRAGRAGEVGFREEGLLWRYPEVVGAWRDHLPVADIVEELNGLAASCWCARATRAGPEDFERSQLPIVTDVTFVVVGACQRRITGVEFTGARSADALVTDLA